MNDSHGKDEGMPDTPRESSLIVSRDQLSETAQLPCVIPQTSKSFRGAFFSPFARAYPPSLAEYGIQQDEFLTFIDGLNEVFVAHPVFQGLGIAGGVMTVFYGLHPVQWTGIGLQFASGLASAATSYIRTKDYVKAVNSDLFNPAGLHLDVMTTKKMMEKVGMPGEKLQLQPLDEASLATPLDPDHPGRITINQQDPRIRRLQALNGCVMPLNFDVPERVAPESLFNKMGAKQSKHLAQKQEKKAKKKRKEAEKKMAEKNQEADKEQIKGDKEVMKEQRKVDKEIEKLEKKVLREKSPDGRRKALKKLEKEKQKLQDEVEDKKKERDKHVAEKRKEAIKEIQKVEKSDTRTANKIRWLVITASDVGDEAEVDSDE